MEPAKRIIRTIAIAALFFFIGFVWPNAKKHDMSGFKALDGKLEVHYIDVGEGDCALLMCGGEAMLIDAGSRDTSKVVTDYLDSHGIRNIKLAVCSHNHADHIGGMSAVLEHCKVETLAVSTTRNENSGYEAMISAAERAGTNILETKAPPDLSLKLGDAIIDFIGPAGPYMDPNNASLVVEVTYGGATFLFTGDMEEISEHEMLDYRLVPKDITVLKVAHHGSDSSTCFSLLTQLDPIYAVISCGEGNDYGHPDKDVLLRLDQACDHVYRTDKHGTIVILTDGANIDVTTEHDYPDNLLDSQAYESAARQSAA